MIKSIFSSSFWKLFGSFCSFFSIPILMDVLSVNEYALWVTLTSLIGWINLFDFGAGYSLRNRVAEYNELNEQSKLKTAISGTFTFYFLTSIVLLLIFTILLFTTDILNNNKLFSIILYVPIIITFPVFIGPFIFQGLSKIPELNFLQFLTPLGWLLILIGVKMYERTDWLLNICLLYTFINVSLRFLIMHKAKNYVSVKYVELISFGAMKNINDIILNGSKFFILQVSSLILFSMGNMVIYNNLNAIDVNVYDTINKIFLLMVTLFSNITSIFWTEISKSKAISDFIKLRHLWKKSIIITLIINILVILFIPIIVWFIEVWTDGKIITSSYSVSFFVIQFIIQTFSYSVLTFLNAFEKMKWQIIFSVISSIAFFPLVNLLIDNGIGFISVPISTSIVLLPNFIYGFIVSRKLLRQ